MVTDSETFQVFFEEANEHLEVLEKELLHLWDEEGQPPNSEMMNTVFRAAHSLKGSSAIAGLLDLAAVAHEMENVLDALRAAELVPTTKLIDTLLEGVDKCIALLQAEADAVEPPSFAQLVASLHEFVAHRPTVEKMADFSIDGIGEYNTFEIHFRPYSAEQDACFDEQISAMKLLGYIEAFKDCTLEQEAPETPTPHWFLRIQAFATEEEIRTAAEPYSSETELSVILIDEEVQDTSSEEQSLESSEGALDKKLPTEKKIDATVTKRSEKNSNSTLRVDVRRIDSLMNMVGELVTAQASIEHLIQNVQDGDLGQLVEAVEDMARSTRNIQEGVLTIRMVPLESTLVRFPRMVHDLANRLNKNVKLIITGQDTEIDKSVAEKLLDPLTHIVRNSLDHGLEDAEGRKDKGKPPQGTLSIHASHAGGEVVIEVVDDGKGIDLELLRSKAEDLGLVTPDEVMSTEELSLLVFHPGLSTAEQVTSVSGRGVGMDVVRTNVDELGGNISIRSELNVGTSVRISLPLTLAVIEGLVIREYGQDYIVPLSSVVESVRLSQVQRRTIPGTGDVCVVRDVTTPIVRLGEVLGGNESQSTPDDHQEGVLLVVDLGTQCLAIQVDKIVDQRQLLVKNLHENFRRVPGIIGATVMSDGNIAMIIDVVGVGELARLASKPGLAA